MKHLLWKSVQPSGVWSFQQCTPHVLKRVNVTSHVLQVGAKLKKHQQSTTSCGISENFQAICPNMLSKVERQTTGIFIHKGNCSKAESYTISQRQTTFSSAIALLHSSSIHFSVQANTLAFVFVPRNLDCIPENMFRCDERCVLAKFHNSTLCVIVSFPKDTQCVVVRSGNDTLCLPNFRITHCVSLRNFALTHLQCLICKRFICVVVKFPNDTSLGFANLATAYLIDLRCLLRSHLAHHTNLYNPNV